MHRRGCLLAFGKTRAMPTAGYAYAPVTATDQSGLGRSSWVQGLLNVACCGGLLSLTRC